MNKKTPFYQQHLNVDAKIVDFGGWDMPIHYGSQIEEHHHVRDHAGMFDVSHMTIIDIRGSDVHQYLSMLLANDINKIRSQPGKAMYSCLLNHDGGVIDDLIVYHMEDAWCRVIVNATTRDKDLKWFQAQSQTLNIDINERTDLAMLAVQGPRAIELCNQALSISATPSPFTAIIVDDLFVGRTGYTGEDGYEIICPESMSESLWKLMLDAGVKPCGLGARDTLRLEAGMNLYGNDMDETTSPLESGLSWTIDLKNEQRKFIGRNALEQQKSSGIKSKLVGLVLEGKGILRAHQVVYGENEKGDRGEITSGTFSPTIQKSIAFARVPKEMNDSCLVEIRNKKIPAKIVKLPFVRQGKVLV